MNWHLNFLQTFEARLQAILVSEIEDSKFKAALSYQFFPAGKRIRPLLMAAFSSDCARLLNHNIDQSFAKIIDFACALEILHTASLIHDDLPALDNDTERRGRPTLHTEVGEGRALLAGDYLISRALGIASASAQKIKPESYKLSKIFADSFCDVCFGQDLDIRNGSDELNQTLELYDLKTGALFKVAFETVRLINFDEKQFVDETHSFVQSYGRSFQVLNDNNDLTTELDPGTRERSSNSDARNKRVTALGLLPAAKRLDFISSINKQTLFSLEALEKSLASYYNKTGFVLTQVREIIKPAIFS